MQLTISYQDGSRRIVNVQPAFFMDAEIKDRYKTIIVTPEQKAMDIAISGGVNPYEILLMEGAELVYTHTIKVNRPIITKEETPKEWHGFMKRDEHVTEKELKATKKEAFTKRWNPRTEPMPWEKGIRLLLNHIK